jgi:integrase/recombinase XerD
VEPEKFLKPDEFAALLKAARDDRDRCILMLLAGAGLRVGELISIRVEDIDFNKAYLHIRAANAKLKKARTVVLLPPVVDALQTYLSGRTSGWLFPSRAGDHFTARQIQKILNIIAERSGLQQAKYNDKAGAARKRIHPHLLRHSFALWSLDSGVPIYDLQKQLGHATLASTGVYLEASPNHRREVYLRSRLSNFLVGEVHD